ncbi:response regulator transcription factor [Vallitalea okinawensis]|uniref:response regulator transcription factor n=1 Tax=Vallitalea okinawensis TaxID=2078660 RepID=UPI000CFA8FB4|nr:response regulator [Vallitalea okinawensis]
MFSVMLLDDEYWVLEDFKSVIDWQEVGFEIVAAVQDTKMAERLIKKFKPDLLFCDIKMPEEDGISFLRRLREQKSTIEVIYLTAYSEFNYAREAIHLGAQGYLLKPVDDMMLLNELQRLKKILEDKQRNKVARNLLANNEENTENAKSIIKRVINDVRQNYYKKLKLSYYAEKYFINSSYLSQQFKQETGKSFTSYILDLRLARAEDLLIQTELSINEISDKIGYSDYVHFSKLFKKHRGESPQQYRNRYRE